MGSPSCLQWASFCLINSALVLLAVYPWLCHPECVQTHFSLDARSHMGSCNKADLAHHYHWFRKHVPVTRVHYGYSPSLWRSQYQASVPLKCPSYVKFCHAIPANGHMESIFSSKYPHFRVAFPSISFHHSKAFIKNPLLQQRRLTQFRFYLLKNNHLSATGKEEKNLPLMTWRSVGL